MTAKKTTSKKTAVKRMSTAAYIKSAIANSKLTDAQILAAARRRAPGQKIGDHYVSWYRWQMKQQAA